MNKEETLAKVNAAMRDVFDNETLEVSRETTADDVDEWDSLSHIRLIVTLEELFKLKFTAAEIGSLKNVGELTDLISAKL